MSHNFAARYNKTFLKFCLSQNRSFLILFSTSLREMCIYRKILDEEMCKGYTQLLDTNIFRLLY